MSQITIQCRLVGSEPTRRYLWKLMAEQNTPLINELLIQISQHEDFQTWRSRGKLPTKPDIVSQLCQPLKIDPRFIGQPSRFYTSAINLVSYIYKSWFTLQQRIIRKLEGQIHWLSILKSDEELIQQSNSSLEKIRAKATKILASNTTDKPSDDSKNNQKKSQKIDRSLSSKLFDAYDRSKNVLTCSAIAYLLKNGCKLPTEPEDLEQFAKRRRQTEIKIERLQQQLNSRLPQGRDLTKDKWLQTLINAAKTIPEDEKVTRSWQDCLLTKPKSLPFPVSFETNEDLIWYKNEKGRLCLHFNGLSEHDFQVYCDQRQLKWFQRFFEDQQIKREGKDQHTSALFTLRSARIVWQEEQGKGNPWDVNRLTLHCTLDTRLWTAEGTEQVRQEKATEVAAIITKMKDKGDLTKNQQAFVKRKRSTLAKLNNPFPRFSKSLYQGQSNILISIAFGLNKPATVAVVDGTTGKAIAYRSAKQLLGKNYRLLNRQRQQKRCSSHQRRKAQKTEGFNQFGESELGQYVDRLIAKAIATLAKTYKAGSIVLPNLGDMREIVESEIKAKAEAKIPNYEEGQKEYAKQYRINVHQWSYGRLMESIKIQASQLGIAIEFGKQSVRGSPQEKAKELAIAVYNSRNSQ